MPTEEQERELELNLSIGTRVILYGTLGQAYTVISMRSSHCGTWYGFRSDEGEACYGYAPMVLEVLAYPVTG